MATFVVIPTENNDMRLVFNDITKLKSFIFDTVEDMMLEAEAEYNMEVLRPCIRASLQAYFESDLDEKDDPLLLDCYLSDLFTIYKKIL